VFSGIQVDENILGGKRMAYDAAVNYAIEMALKEIEEDGTRIIEAVKNTSVASVAFPLLCESVEDCLESAYVNELDPPSEKLSELGGLFLALILEAYMPL